MNTQIHPSEKGQAIILIVLAMVILLGFTALAIDGSMIYSDRRYAQSVSDSAALAGAAAAAHVIEAEEILYDDWVCQSVDMTKIAKTATSAAIKSAAQNDFVLDNDISDQHGVIAECKLESSTGIIDKYLDVNILITLDTQTAFAHLLFSGNARNTTRAVARVRPRSTLAYGYAIVVLNPDDCKGMNTGAEFHGTADVIVDEGGIFSNGCLRGVGTQNVSVNGARIHYRSEYINTGNSSFSPTPVKVKYQMTREDYDITQPNCSDPAAHHLDGKDLRGMLEPGLYCVDGDATINAGDTLTGYGVTIVMINGRLHINGHAMVKLTAPPQTALAAPAVPGVVIYAPPFTNYRDVNKNGILLNGTSNSYFSGTILAPALDVYVNGTSADTYNSQIIGWNVQVGGTAETYVHYNNKNLYQRPPMVELNR